MMFPAGYEPTGIWSASKIQRLRALVKLKRIERELQRRDAVIQAVQVSAAIIFAIVGWLVAAALA
jgi:hypothetical protein